MVPADRRNRLEHMSDYRKRSVENPLASRLSQHPIADVGSRRPVGGIQAASEKHAFWSDDYSLSEWLAARKVPLGSAQSTDAYLLKLCQRKQGTLATFDHRIRPSLIGENSPSLIQYILV